MNDNLFLFPFYLIWVLVGLLFLIISYFIGGLIIIAGTWYYLEEIYNSKTQDKKRSEEVQEKP